MLNNLNLGDVIQMEVGALLVGKISNHSCEKGEEVCAGREKGYIDYQIPFLSAFIIPYVLAYIQWIVGYMAIARNGREYCHTVMGGEILSKIMIGMLFIFFPTTMLREEIIGNDLLSRMVEVLYRIDPPTNLFPSIHCLESYICMKAALEMKSHTKKFRMGMIGMSILVFLSTVFIKQHVILDFFGAVIVAEIGRLISGYFFQGYFKLHPVKSN